MGPLSPLYDESALVVRSGRLRKSDRMESEQPADENSLYHLGSCSLCKTGAEVPPTSWELAREEEDGDFIRS